MKHEAANTRKMLACVPAAHFDWKPHPKSMTLGRLANHVAELSGWPEYTIESDGLNFATMEYRPAPPTNTQDLLDLHDKGVVKSLESLGKVTDEQLGKLWKLSSGERIILEQPKAVVLRGLCFNHLYHHRGQLSVFLRLLNIAIPGMYGPSADEMESMAAKAN